ncbi:MAG TPA: rhodanese-like domain-containing protein [Saprospiraceae bacterium]|nr:rhodanese-like domain-containing protein [Saprospiraceae bacterium]
MSTAIQRLSPREAYAEYILGGVLVDVRNREESSIKALGIKQLYSVPMNELGERLSEIPANRTIILVSRYGNTGRDAANYLAEHGYEHVALVEGGFSAWESEGLPVSYSA